MVFEMAAEVAKGMDCCVNVSYHVMLAVVAATLSLSLLLLILLLAVVVVEEIVEIVVDISRSSKRREDLNDPDVIKVVTQIIIELSQKLIGEIPTS